MINPYSILGVTPDTPKDEIKRAYRKLCRLNHPDVGGDASKFDEINKAYNMILDGVNLSVNVIPKHKTMTHTGLFKFSFSN